MVVCPHCKEKGIRLLSKVWSDSACPSRCGRCGRYSYFPSRYKHPLTIGFNALFVAAAAGSFLYQSWLPLFGFSALLPATYYLSAHRVPGAAISERQAATNRRIGNLFLLAVVAMAVVTALWWCGASGAQIRYEPAVANHSIGSTQHNWEKP